MDQQAKCFFSTPIYFGNIKDNLLCTRTAIEILDKQKPYEEKRNCFDYVSSEPSPNLTHFKFGLELEELVIANIRTFLRMGGQEFKHSFKILYKSLILKDGSFKNTTNNNFSAISGYLFLNAPKLDEKLKEGFLSFVDPREKSKASIYYNDFFWSGETVMFKPENGDIVLFPSWLDHQILPFKSNSEMVILSLDFLPKPSLE